MAIRNIRQEGDEILKKKSRPVEEIDDKIKELIKSKQQKKRNSSFQRHQFCRSVHINHKLFCALGICQ